MKKINKKVTICKKVSGFLALLVYNYFRPDALWIQNHIAVCPRCRKKMRAFAKVELALTLIKSESHNLDLLKRANSQAVGVLKHSLRYSKKAQALKNKFPEPSLLSRLNKYKNAAGKVAACIAILFLLKTGIFTSMEKFQDTSRRALESYYAKHVGQEMADEIFSV